MPRKKRERRRDVERREEKKRENIPGRKLIVTRVHVAAILLIKKTKRAEHLTLVQKAARQLYTGTLHSTVGIR